MNELKDVKKAWYKKPWIIVLGVLLLPLLLLLSPLLLFLIWRKRRWKTWIKVSISVIPSIWALFIIMMIKGMIELNNEKIELVNEYYTQINAAIDQGDFASAKATLGEVKNVSATEERKVNKLIEEIDNFLSDNYFEAVLIEMTEEEFEKLKIGQLDKKYFTNESINNRFIEKLVEHIPVKEEMLVTLAEQRRLEEEVARVEREKEERRKRIESAFSSWDGSHRNLTKVIKDMMNDPKSYDHDETVFWDMGDHLIVQTTFRGKNAFGGVVKNTVKAKVDLDGNVLEIIDWL